MCVRVLQDRRARDDGQVVDLGQLCEDILVDARREELVSGVWTQILQRQHGDGSPTPGALVRSGAAIAQQQPGRRHEAPGGERDEESSGCVSPR